MLWTVLQDLAKARASIAYTNSIQKKAKDQAVPEAKGKYLAKINKNEHDRIIKEARLRPKKGEKDKIIQEKLEKAKPLIRKKAKAILGEQITKKSVRSVKE